MLMTGLNSLDAVYVCMSGSAHGAAQLLVSACLFFMLGSCSSPAIHVRTDNGKVAFKCCEVDLYHCARMDVVSCPVLRGGGSEAGRRRQGP